MRKILALVFVIFMAGCYAGYVQWAKWERARVAALVAAAAPAPKPQPTATPAQIAAAPAPLHLLPEGYYIVLSRVDVTTDSGITGITRGTKVKFVSATPNGMVVTDGNIQFQVGSQQVTNDLDVARGLKSPPEPTPAPTLASLAPTPPPMQTAQASQPAQATAASQPAGDTTQPAGVYYYLLKGASVDTDSGITGIPPGTKVTLLHPTENGVLATDGVNQFEVAASQLTSDPAVAQKVIDADTQARAKIAGYVQQQEAIVRKQEDDRLKSMPLPGPLSDEQQSPPPAVEAPSPAAGAQPPASPEGADLFGGGRDNATDKKSADPAGHN